MSQLRIDMGGLFKAMFPDTHRSWKIQSLNSPSSDEIEVRLCPDVYASLMISEHKMAAFADDKYRLVDYLQRNLVDMQNSLVDMLDKSIGRPKRSEAPTCGRCNYCGAPYGT